MFVYSYENIFGNYVISVDDSDTVILSKQEARDFISKLISKGYDVSGVDEELLN